MDPRELFDQQCKRRFGTANPERMRLEHWETMVRRGCDPYAVRQELGLPLNYPTCCGASGCKAPEPDWCFDRMGMSRTVMADGRIICIAGEHEDFYDPDFCIYNDVVVLRPATGEAAVTLESGEVEIYGYPEPVFPPTDFHSATLVTDRIFVIGRLGYNADAPQGGTPVLAVDASTYRAELLVPRGPSPGWIHNHHASYDRARHAITVRGGKIARPGDSPVVPNYAAHRLHLKDLRWELIAERERHRMFSIDLSRPADDFREPTPENLRPRGVEHLWLLPEDHGIEVYGIDVQGVRITFEDLWIRFRVHIEGALEEDVVDAIIGSVTENLSSQTGVEWKSREIDLSTDW